MTFCFCIVKPNELAFSMPANKKSSIPVTLATSSYCAPGRTRHFQVYKTCYTHDELIEFAKDWNSRNAGDTIAHPDKKSMTQLYAELRKRYGEKRGCQNEVCWIKETPALSSVAKDIFRPLRSDKWRAGREWLSSMDIMHVMKQYEASHIDYVFLGVFPVDFEQKVQGQCVARTMCNFTLKKLKDIGKSRFGMVINLDKHDQPGSHWVAVFGCMNLKDPKYGVWYFDSGGLPPEPIPGTRENPILDFLKRLKQEAIGLFGPDHATKFWVRYNPVQKQFKNTECGMFCLLFQILCLEHRDKDYEGIRNLIGNDDFAHQFRKVFYTTVEHAAAQQNKTKANKPGPSP